MVTLLCLITSLAVRVKKKKTTTVYHSLFRSKFRSFRSFNMCLFPKICSFLETVTSHLNISFNTILSLRIHITFSFWRHNWRKKKKVFFTYSILWRTNHLQFFVFIYNWQSNALSLAWCPCFWSILIGHITFLSLTFAQFACFGCYRFIGNCIVRYTEISWVQHYEMI